MSSKSLGEWDRMRSWLAGDRETKAARRLLRASGVLTGLRMLASEHWRVFTLSRRSSTLFTDNLPLVQDLLTIEDPPRYWELYTTIDHNTPRPLRISHTMAIGEILTKLEALDLVKDSSDAARVYLYEARKYYESEMWDYYTLGMQYLAQVNTLLMLTQAGEISVTNHPHTPEVHHLRISFDSYPWDDIFVFEKDALVDEAPIQLLNTAYFLTNKKWGGGNQWDPDLPMYDISIFDRALWDAREIDEYLARLPENASALLMGAEPYLGRYVFAHPLHHIRPIHLVYGDVVSRLVRRHKVHDAERLDRYYYSIDVERSIRHTLRIGGKVVLGRLLLCLLYEAQRRVVGIEWILGVCEKIEQILSE